MTRGDEVSRLDALEARVEGLEAASAARDKLIATMNRAFNLKLHPFQFPRALPDGTTGLGLLEPPPTPESEEDR